MDVVTLTIEDRHELDNLLVALLQRRERLELDTWEGASVQIQILDTIIGRLNWDAAATQLTA